MKPTPAVQEVLSYFASGMPLVLDFSFREFSKTAIYEPERQVLEVGLGWLRADCDGESPGAAAMAEVYRYAMRLVRRAEVLNGFRCQWETTFRAFEWLAEQARVAEEERWPTAARLVWTMPATQRAVQVLGGDIELARVVEVLQAKPHPVFEIPRSPLISHFRFIRVDEAGYAAQEPRECLDWPVIVGRDQGRRIPLVGWRQVEQARAEGRTHVPACLLTSKETRLAFNRANAQSTSLNLFEPDDCEGTESDG